MFRSSEYLFNFSKPTILREENICLHHLQRGQLNQQMGGDLCDPAKTLLHLLPDGPFLTWRKISRHMGGHEFPLDSQADKSHSTPCPQETGSLCHGLLIFCCSYEAHTSLLCHFKPLKPFGSFIYLLNIDTEMKKYSLNKDTNNSLQEVLKTVLQKVGSLCLFYCGL